MNIYQLKCIVSSVHLTFLHSDKTHKLGCHVEHKWEVREDGMPVAFPSFVYVLYETCDPLGR